MKGTTSGGEGREGGQAAAARRAEQSQQSAEGTLVQLAMRRTGRQSRLVTENCSRNIHWGAAH